ncbi:MAG: hypothetical protein QOH03_749 [Kribbellaceae bacterium]|jgi:hypothetical protein|nr:hypothetical protein [Kribbellaceae bacterium]
MITVTVDSATPPEQQNSLYCGRQRADSRSGEDRVNL